MGGVSPYPPSTRASRTNLLDATVADLVPVLAQHVDADLAVGKAHLRQRLEIGLLDLGRRGLGLEAAEDALDHAHGLLQDAFVAKLVKLRLRQLRPEVLQEGGPVHAGAGLRSAGHALEDVADEALAHAGDDFLKVPLAQQGVVVRVRLGEEVPEEALELEAAEVDASGHELRPLDVAAAVEVHGGSGAVGLALLQAPTLEGLAELPLLQAAHADALALMEEVLHRGPLVGRPVPSDQHRDADVQRAPLRQLRQPPHELLPGGPAAPRGLLGRRRLQEEGVLHALRRAGPRRPLEPQEGLADLDGPLGAVGEPVPARARPRPPKAQRALLAAVVELEGPPAGQ
mmetsp:Transcript_32872/g.93420  ORF Transcript_32872/g.93420 Transcript_32872/m.93420 type:complete len:343 (-) Transcript_32872:1203-2231(-)